mmetsp:Transcript_60062/g.106900  ORF Transcript_60062/g.106900 Transcript_60062/m.106900 type:complete len:88 (-) Transcript_60062:103-366(-)
MSQLHLSDSMFCHRHRGRVGLYLMDEEWRKEALPDDEMTLPEGHQINLDESDDNAPELDGRDDKWCELPLTQFLEEEAEVGADRNGS